MSQLTAAQMRAIVQTLVCDSNPNAPGLQTTDYTLLINDAISVFAELFPDTLSLSGLIGTVTLNAATMSASVVPTTGYVIRNITGAFLSGTGGMMPKDPLDILRLQKSAPTLGVPTLYSLESSAPGTSAGGGNTYTARFHPIPDGAYTVNFYGTVQPIDLVNDADYTVFQHAECRIIARMAAIDAARLLGRTPEFIQNLSALLPDRIKQHMVVMVRDTLPRTYLGKPVA